MRLSGCWRFSCFVFFVALCRLPGWTQAGPAEAPYSTLQSGNLTIWISASPQLIDRSGIQGALAHDFPGLQVDIQTIPPVQLLDALLAARVHGGPPQILFLGSWTQGAQLIRQPAITRMIGRSRFRSNGWWFQVDDAPHALAGETFLRWLVEPQHWTSPWPPNLAFIHSDLQPASSAAIQAVSGMANGAYLSVLDPEAASFDLSAGGDCGSPTSISTPSVEYLNGNSHLAWGWVLSDMQAQQTIPCNGLVHSFVILRKQDGAWKTLFLSRTVSLPIAQSWAEQFEALGLTAGGDPGPQPPRLLSPADGEKQTRFPRQDISWQQISNQPAAYLVESQFAEGSRWSQPTLTFVDPASYSQQIVRMPSPFGVGMQPHRWRVWAIAHDGRLALSEWRTIQFTN